VTRVRTWLAHAVIAVVAGGGLVAIATGIERWPFSPYPMYAKIRPASYSMPVLFGVTAEAPEREVPLFQKAYLYPFNTAVLRDAFVLQLRQSAAHPDAPRQALLDCLQRYERRRRAGLHDGPALRGMRLYRLTWALLPGASNFERPEGKELLLEVGRPPDGRS
jgi:hypothetical protein